MKQTFQYRPKGEPNGKRSYLAIVATGSKAAHRIAKQHGRNLETRHGSEMLYRAKGTKAWRSVTAKN